LHNMILAVVGNIVGSRRSCWTVRPNRLVNANGR
jgi:hypothetical protein